MKWILNKGLKNLKDKFQNKIIANGTKSMIFWINFNLKVVFLKNLII